MNPRRWPGRTVQLLAALAVLTLYVVVVTRGHPMDWVRR